MSKIVPQPEGGHTSTLEMMLVSKAGFASNSKISQAFGMRAKAVSA
jgi:hypothetical protein